MDSKLKRLTIFAAVSLVVLIGLIEVLINFTGENRKTDASTPSVSTQTGQSLVYQTGQIGNDLSAFLRDDTFFDSEEDKLLEDLLYKKLTLIATSVEKDLRIKIVDEEGALVTGESFYITIDGTAEFKDLDKDGLVYVGDLPAAEYSVSLNAIAGYRVPNVPVKVRVKEKLEYIPIEDISYLTKKEADVEAEVDDAICEISDGDSTEIKTIQAVSDKAKLGIDVSGAQGTIDWTAVKKAGVEFAIIRCGYRGASTGSLVEDAYFARNIKEASDADIQVGVYFFSQAVSEVEAVEEASMVVNLLKDYSVTFPVFLNIESAGETARAANLDIGAKTAICKAFCTTIENAGYKAGLYASGNGYGTNINIASVEKYHIWIAEYRKAPVFEGYYDMWQYTSKGSIKGIDGNVNINICYVEYK